MKHLFKWKGEWVPVEYQKLGSELWIYYQGQVFVRPAKANIKSFRPTAEMESTGVILAPMPGKITKLLKAQGDSVAKGDSIVVMEAMKMEYTLQADVSGILEELSCKLNEQVVLGKSLAKIKKNNIEDLKKEL
ncbi:MAG TPA: acetyl-CoA carboxylase biotin carboxyl carrier protein subunit [Pseudobdellovibrionaceae bacterium]|nr:acetyl-CoA carboxylase biotin carboxyl carrier protein subunit [Pseudobdellovibrionaceae bacterium]